MKIRTKTIAQIALYTSVIVAGVILYACKKDEDFAQTPEKDLDTKVAADKFIEAPQDGIEGEYIIVFKEGLDDTAIPVLNKAEKTSHRKVIKTQSITMAQSIGLQEEDITHVYADAINAFSAVHMTREQALELSKNPAVAYVEQNRTFKLDDF